MESEALTCPVCGQPARSSAERDEPVRNRETGRDHGWRRTITTYLHLDGSEHRVPGGPIFAR